MLRNWFRKSGGSRRGAHESTKPEDAAHSNWQKDLLSLFSLFSLFFHLSDWANQGDVRVGEPASSRSPEA